MEKPQSAKPARERITSQKVAVRRALESLDRFATVNELHDRIKANGDHASLASVYRILRKMVADGAVDSIGAFERETLVRICSTEHHHRHLICRSCNSTIEIVDEPLEQLLAQIADRYSYSEPRHQVELSGICGNCSTSVKRNG